MKYLLSTSPILLLAVPYAQSESYFWLYVGMAAIALIACCIMFKYLEQQQPVKPKKKRQSYPTKYKYW